MSAFILIRCDDITAARSLKEFILLTVFDNAAVVMEFGNMAEGNLESVQSAVDTLAENMDKVIVLEKVEDEE